jgi:hypothetical protein
MISSVFKPIYQQLSLRCTSETYYIKNLGFDLIVCEFFVFIFELYFSVLQTILINYVYEFFKSDGKNDNSFLGYFWFS